MQRESVPAGHGRYGPPTGEGTPPVRTGFAPRVALTDSLLSARSLPSPPRMTGLSFTLGPMDATMSTTVWWTCLDCGVDAEMPAPDSAGGTVPCPDCTAEMAEQWRWDSAA